MSLENLFSQIRAGKVTANSAYVDLNGDKPSRAGFYRGLAEYDGSTAMSAINKMVLTANKKGVKSYSKLILECLAEINTAIKEGASRKEVHDVIKTQALSSGSYSFMCRKISQFNKELDIELKRGSEKEHYVLAKNGYSQPSRQQRATPIAPSPMDILRANRAPLTQSNDSKMVNGYLIESGEPPRKDGKIMFPPSMVSGLSYLTDIEKDALISGTNQFCGTAFTRAMKLWRRNSVG